MSPHEPESEAQLVLEGSISLGEFLATSFGPDGQQKLLYSGDQYTVTNDIHRIIDEIELVDPSARFIAQYAVAQKEDVGDGSMTIPILVGALCKEALTLIEKGFLRTTIEDGFDQAKEVAIEEISKRERSSSGTDEQVLKAVARTAVKQSQSKIIEILLAASQQIDVETNGRDLSNVIFRTKPDEEPPYVELIKGVILERDVVFEGMDRSLDQPRIAVIGGGKKAGSGIEEPTLFRAGGNEGQGRTEVSFSVEDPDDIAKFRESEISEVRSQVETLVNANVDAVFCTMGISDIAKRLLNKAGITAFRTLTETQAALLARATGATVVMDIQDLTADDIGTAEELKVDTHSEKPTVKISGCTHGDVVTISIGGPINEMREEKEKDFRTAITVLLSCLDGENVVAAGGGIEVLMANAVKEHAKSVNDRSAIAMEAFADALETIPTVLARNAGENPIDILTRIRAQPGAGFDTDNDAVRNTYPNGPLTTSNIARTVVDTSAHVAKRLIRIDDVLEGDIEDSDWIDENEIDPRPVPERDFDY